MSDYLVNVPASDATSATAAPLVTGDAFALTRVPTFVDQVGVAALGATGLFTAAQAGQEHLIVAGVWIAAAALWAALNASHRIPSPVVLAVSAVEAVATRFLPL